MFNEVLLRRYSKIINLDYERAENALKRQAKYLKVNPHYLLKSFVALEDEIKEQEREKATAKKAQSKNIYIQKYKDEIVKMYCKDGFGYLKISRALKILHNVTISKSTIENFIKKNELTKGEN